MLVDTSCPDPGRVRQLIAGDLPEAELDAICAHVTVCQACTTILRSISHEQTLLGAVSPLPGSWTADSEDRAVIERLIARWQDPSAGAESRFSSTVHPLEKRPNEADETTVENRSAVHPDAPHTPAKSLLHATAATDELGCLGAYRLLGRIGSGGMGVVFEAEDQQLGRRVAVKAMLPSLLEREDHRLRFLREARAAASIDHDNIVPIHQVGEDQGVPFFVMPLLRGESLESLLRREGRVSVAQTVHIGRQIALGIAAAHARGLVHRDIKPANIWLEQRGEQLPRVRILDFGLARDEDDDLHLTKTGSVTGTPAFMAPEQARGERADARSDLFSIGCVLYCLLTGKPPFSGRNSAAMLHAIINHQPQSLDEVQPTVPRGLTRLVMQLLEKDPERRTGTADDVAGMLQEIEEEFTRGIAVAARDSNQLDDTTVEQPLLSKNASVTLDPNRSGSIKLAGARLGSRHTAITAIVATAIALLAIGLYCSGLWSVRVETPHGTVVLDFDAQQAAGAAVSVDEQQRVTLKLQPDDEPVTLDVDPGTHQLKVSKPGFEIFTREFSMADDGLERIRVRLVPKTAPPEAAVGANPLPASEPATVLAPPAREHDSLTASAQKHDAGQHPDTDVDRAVATWAHLRRARIGLTTKASGYVDIHADDELPPGDFKLVVLDLTGRLVRDAELAQLDRLDSLSQLMLHSTGVTDEGLVQLGHLPALRGLYFGHSHLSDAGLKTIVARFPQIETLHIGYSQVTDLGVECLLDCPQLSELRLEVRTITDRSLPALSQMHQLRTLNLIDSSVSALGIDKLRQALPACRIYNNATAPAPPARRTALPADVPFPGLAPGPARLAGVRRWQIETLAPRGDIFAVALNRDGGRVACGSPIGTMRIIDVATSKTLSVVPAHTGMIWAMACSPTEDLIVTAGEDGAVRLFDSGGGFLRQLGSHDGTARSVAFSRDGSWVASGGFDSKVRLWRTTGEPGPILTGHSSQIDGVAWHPSGQKLASASLDGTVRIWDLTGAWSTNVFRSHELNGHLGGVLGVSWSLDGKLLASAGTDGAVLLWTEDGARHATLSGHGTAVTSVCWGGKGLIATSGEDKTIRLWQPDGTLLKIQKMEVGRINDLEWSGDGRRLVIATDRSGIRFLDEAGEWDGAIALDTASTRAVSFNSQGELAAVGDGGLAGVWNSDGTRTELPKQHKTTILSVSWNPSGSQLVSGSWDAPVRTWTAAGAAVATHDGTHPAAWSPATDDLAWTSGSDIHLAGADTPVRVLRGHQSQVVQLEWNSNGTQLASADASGSIRLWNRDGSPAGTIASDPLVTALAWHPKKPLLASGCMGNGSIKLWGLDGTLARTWKAHVKGITVLDYSPDGERLFSSAYDQQVRVWNEKGDAIGMFPGPMAIVCAFARNTAGHEIATAHIDGAVCLWDDTTFEPKATTVLFSDGHWARLDSTGISKVSDPEELDSRFVVVVEDESGAMHMMAMSEFRTRISHPGN